MQSAQIAAFPQTLRLVLCIAAAPEVIANSRTYDGKLADVWSSGVMLYVMVFCEYPFERPEDAGDPHRFQKVCILHLLLPPPRCVMQSLPI